MFPACDSASGRDCAPLRVTPFASGSVTAPARRPVPAWSGTRAGAPGRCRRGSFRGRTAGPTAGARDAPGRVAGEQPEDHPHVPVHERPAGRSGRRVVVDTGPLHLRPVPLGRRVIQGERQSAARPRAASPPRRATGGDESARFPAATPSCSTGGLFSPAARIQLVTVRRPGPGWPRRTARPAAAPTAGRGPTRGPKTSGTTTGAVRRWHGRFRPG